MPQQTGNFKRETETVKIPTGDFTLRNVNGLNIPIKK